ncbi:MAG TPA: hypothetical protein PKM17_02205, partial [Syntrophorhabdus sp.]|nr:hypothetical protein [Syntrophorhabdus sp.]
MKLSYKQMHTTRKPFVTEDWAEQVFLRTAGVPITQGNKVQILKDAGENYPAWVESMKSAERWIHFESYIMHDDDAGREFSEILAAKAREGIRVKVIYDWLGG